MRLIDADALRDAIIEKEKQLDRKFQPFSSGMYDFLRKLVDEQPTINPADLVPMADAFGSIVWYNGYLSWFRELEQALRNHTGKYNNFPCPIPADGWNTDLHCLWMFLVGLFGDWGTSIRGGWIEDREGAAAFLRAALAEYGYEEEDENDG